MFFKLPRLYPGVDAICPFGALETLYKFFTEGGMLKRLMPSNIVLFIGIVLLGIFFSRYYCAWICHLGTLQEFFAKLGHKIFKKKFIIPENIDYIMRYLKYIILLGTIIWTWKVGDLVIRYYDPFAAYGHLTSGLNELLNEFLIGFMILIMSLILSIFYDRFFCKYLCPLGAFLGVLHKISFFRIKRESTTCISCNLCSKKCPMNIKVAQLEKISSAECINCLECVTLCPIKKETLVPTIFNIKIKPLYIALSGVSLFIITILLSKGVGYWKVVDATLMETVNITKELDVSVIRGKHTLLEVANVFNINIDDLYTKLKITKDKISPETQIKTVGKLIGVEEEYTNTVRIAVQELIQPN